MLRQLDPWKCFLVFHEADFDEGDQKTQSINSATPKDAGGIPNTACKAEQQRVDIEEVRMSCKLPRNASATSPR